ncbi:polyhydroxybutyrate depolymerase [Streptosporangium becharense]|uniref:Polyhydroxybutyrate depolymerase n=1 Tax=Streptosporangium becharense TaxID=1816182 RepID=A0A7W9IB49_9ACTN|nr:PHB depolymerase family esterase [Streptosporangium becharense]MBB2910792.1 polyhydroxybutyrate depolymerase [Streptosporangium becharense]MBB5817487.1 polyhydroxybutyrate depolymerase [Streptosporangium becharense]
MAVACVLSGCAAEPVPPANPSAAATRTPAAASAEQPVRKAGTVEGTLRSGGTRRSYLLHRPEATSARLPLLICLHGRGGNAADMPAVTRFDREAAGMLVVYPQGLDRQWDDGAGLDRDVRFLRELIGHLAATEGADAERVYITGFSNGAGMALRFAAEQPGLVKGVGAVAGQLPPKIEPRGAVPLLLIHGDRDPVRPFAGLPESSITGTGADRPTAGIGAEPTAEIFARAADAGDERRQDVPDKVPDDGTSLRRLTWSGGTAPVELIIIRGGGHRWPGRPGVPRLNENGVVSEEIDVSRTIVDFFAGRNRP